MKALLIIRQPRLAAAMAATLACTGDARVVGRVTSLRAAIRHLRGSDADVAVLEMDLPDGQGAAGVRLLRVASPHTRVIALSCHPSPEAAREALRAGATVFADTDTSPDILLDLLRLDTGAGAVVEAETALRLADAVPARPGSATDLPGAGLTPREGAVLELLAGGHSLPDIAQQMGISVHTARGHVKKIMRKLGAHSQLAAVVVASERGLVCPPGLGDRVEHAEPAVPAALHEVPSQG